VSKSRSIPKTRKAVRASGPCAIDPAALVTLSNILQIDSYSAIVDYQAFDVPLNALNYLEIRICCAHVQRCITKQHCEAVPALGYLISGHHAAPLNRTAAGVAPER
jgi:hypothetical protein